MSRLIYRLRPRTPKLNWYTGLRGIHSMPRRNTGSGPGKGDLEGANQTTPSAGGSGPRGIGMLPGSPNPAQSGPAGTSPQPETSGGRKGQQEQVATSIDRERIDDEF